MKRLKMYEQYMDEKFGDRLRAGKDKFIKKAKKFGKALGQEGKETKEVFKKIKNSIKEGEPLTKEEKAEIKKQMGDILKTAGLTAATFLPGGVIYIMLTQNKHTKDYTLPSAFKESDDDGDLDYLK
tara:strand:- start:6420 stop:6797 length:378 start_codon:yes stop_codon:yes gene_type:complete